MNCVAPLPLRREWGFFIDSYSKYPNGLRSKENHNLKKGGKNKMIYIGSDTIFYVDGLKDSITNEYQNSATVTGTLYDLEDTSLGTITFSYVAGTDGDYTGTLDSSVTSTLTDCGEYIVAIQAVTGGSTMIFRDRQNAGYKGFN